MDWCAAMVKRMLKHPDFLLFILAATSLVYLGRGLSPSSGEWNEGAAEAVAAEPPEKPAGKRVKVPAPGEPVRFLMFNVQNYFVPEDARRSTYRINYKSREKKEAVADLIASRKPDVVGLIEMGGTEALNDLAVRLEKRGLSYQERFVLERPGEERALAVLSRLPLARNDSKANYPLYGERNRCMLRGILDVTVKAEDGRLFRIVGVHLKSKVSDDQAAADSLRRREADTLARYLHQAQRERPGLPMLVFGDFNDTPSSPAVQTVARGVNGKSAMTRLSPEDGSGTGWTLYYRNEDTYSAFDHIFINKTLSSRVKGRPLSGVVETEPKNSPSDHRALWCELK